ncbi:histidine phosphatase family protein [Streptococcus iniae]|uniref:Histidine phosphatase family protein n=1 Tax=Streptococcus iniae TaxID=1346 RepID=A0A3L8GIJ3_STRIN|nr:histidine phosphatase family protein [Streptococcus iniae]AGM98881.1 phosphoglycerate mutase family protein [Streptococcus iniae SF1]AHY15839.1 phosphoglycerate mutase [Streptococcus iniae]AHY17707.1 phosphoglycerate mutase [Streptococcus iniae]AJG25999.1 phosphoglycerate mutase [Streptococcus iniae]APD31876.1 histidine phosphatase family protein [Streptococcus iniae]
MTKLYLMRHGQTLFNTQGRVQGACDSPLTEVGIKEALLAKTYFEQEDIVFDKVYSSTQERATDTAKLIVDQNVYQLKGLKEMNFGTFEAQPEYLLPKHREGASSFEDLLVPYGGEDIRQVGKRLKVEMQKQVVKEKEDGVILMVSHGAAMWGLCLELGITFPPGVFFTNCSICEFDYDAGQFTLKKLVQPTNNFKSYHF